MGRPSARTKWLVTFAAPVVALLLLELGLRLFGFTQPTVEVAVIIWTEDQDPSLDEPKALHKADAWSLWAPRPYALVERGTKERIGQLGFRGPEPATPRDPAVLRVVLLGESSTFGMSVPWEQTCAPRLQSLLATRGVQAEVINGGVIGHTACQGIGRYCYAVRPLHPDVVVIAYGAQNEHAPCQGPCDREKLAISRRQLPAASHPWQALSQHVRVCQLINWFLIRREGPELLRLRDEQEDQRALGPDLIGQLDWSGCRRVPLDDFDAALRELCADVAADGAQPILCSLPRQPATEARLPILPLYSQVIERVGRQLGVPVVDVRLAVQQAIAAGAEPASFFSPADTWHLGPTGQALYAQTLAEQLAPERAR